MLNNLKKGFTLVELLIVIALIAAIALIVIAAINPIEQANRARDAKFNADSGQLVSAIERYYSARSEFPWVTSGGATNNDAVFPFVTAGSINVGVCGASCAVDGSLITSQELKQEFRNRDFITDSGGADNTKKIYIGKAAGSSASVYACYVPSSTATRQKGCAEGDVYTLNVALGTRTQVPVGTCSTANHVWGGTGADGNGSYVCLPQ